MSFRACTVCGADRPPLLYVCDEDFVSRLVFEGHRQAYSIVRCRRCSLVYVGEEVSDALLGELYSAGYYQGRDGSGFHDYSAEEAKYRPRFAGRIARMRGFVEEGRDDVRVLDVGCALGWFVSEAVRAGWAAEGVDKSEYCRSFAAEKLGVTVHAGGLEDVTIPDAGYDLVTLWDTIEHLPDPRGMLATVRDYVAPGGWVALTTGNHDSVRARLKGRDWALVRPPKHLFYFTPRTLTSLVEQAGFAVIDTWPELPGKIPGPVREVLGRASLDTADIFGVLAVRPG